MTEDAICVIPAYNSARSLSAVVQQVRNSVQQISVIAVDDGSTDGTGEIARRTCDRVITFSSNRGKGAALRAGFAAALETVGRVVVTIDADGQHDGAAITALIAALEHSDMSIGVRSRSGGGMPFRRRFANAVSSAAIQAVVGAPIPDSQSGFRAMRRRVVEDVWAVASGDRYEYETEFIILAALAGFTIAAVPVRTIYGDETSHFRALSDSARVVRAIWRNRAVREGRRRPRT
ncbi:MAG: glycosyltransferase family 2 protein [Gemmatimonadaceae bacterium]